MYNIYRAKDIIYLRNPAEMTYILCKWMPEIVTKEVEMFCIIYLDEKRRLLEIACQNTGDCESVNVDIEEVIKRGISINSKYVAIVHNHPTICFDSGESSPSDGDKKFVDYIRNELKNHNLILVDSIIIPSYSENTKEAKRGMPDLIYSFKESGMIVLNQYGELETLKKKFKQYKNSCPPKIVIKDSTAVMDKPFINRLFSKWGVYDRWEKETEKPFDFSKNAKEFKSTTPDYNHEYITIKDKILNKAKKVLEKIN